MELERHAGRRLRRHLHLEASEKTPLTGVAIQHIIKSVLEENELPEGIFNLIIGDAEIGAKMAADGRVPLVSATGSTRHGQESRRGRGRPPGQVAAGAGRQQRHHTHRARRPEHCHAGHRVRGRGTCGQRCTSTRRLIIHDSIYDDVKARLLKIYPNLPIGHPLQDGTLVGPLIDKDSVDGFQKALKSVAKRGRQAAHRRRSARRRRLRNRHLRNARHRGGQE